MKIYQILLQLQLKILVQIENWIYCDVWTIFRPHLRIHFELKIFIDILSIWFISMKIFRYYCSSNSNHLVQIENWTRCDVWTIFSPRCTNTLWISNFHCNCICIFNSMKIYQILLQFQLQPFSFKLKVEHDVMYGQYSVHVVQIHFEFQIFIAIVYVYLTRWRSIRYYCSSNSNHLVSNWKLNTMWCMDNIQYTFYKYTLSLKFSLQLYLYI